MRAFVPLILWLLVVINVILTFVVLKSRSTNTLRKVLFIVGVWVFPFFGALLVGVGLGPPPIGNSETTNDPKIPW
jgi:hypothetical protein